MQSFLDAVAVLASCCAVYFDERSRRIPNRLTYSTFLLGVTLRVAWALTGVAWQESLLPAAIGGGSLALLFGVLSTVGVLGFGDTKLLIGLGVLVGHPLSLQLAVCTLVSGGLVAVVTMLRRRSSGAVAASLARPQELVRERVDDPTRAQKHLFGYALAIAMGTIWGVVGRQLPFVLPL